jgi:hypothetical protein
MAPAAAAGGVTPLPKVGLSKVTVFLTTEPSRVGASYSLHLEVYAHVLEGDLAIQAAHAASASRLAGGPTMS